MTASTHSFVQSNKNLLILGKTGEGKTHLACIKRLSQVRALILDDFGLRNYTHDEATVLVDLPL